MHNKRQGPPGRGIPEHANDFKGSIKRLFSELKSLKTIIFVALILSIFSACLSIFAPDILANLTDEISKGLIINQENFNTIIDNIQNNNIEDITIDGVVITIDDQRQLASLLNELDMSSSYNKIDELPQNIKEIVKPTMNLKVIKSITIILIIMYIISAVCNFIQSLCMTDVANKFAKRLRSDISIKINRLPLKFFDKHQSGDTLSRVTNDVDTIAQTMNQSLSSLVSNVVLLIGSLIMMLITNWIMAITAILSSIIGFVIVSLILKKSQKYFIARQEELGNLNGHIEEVYSGLKVIKLYNGKQESDLKFDEFNNKLKDADFKGQFFSGIMHPLMHFIGNLGFVSVCIVGALLVMNDMITFGIIVAFVTYVKLFTNPLSQIAQCFSSFQSAAAASERVFEFIDEEEMDNEQDVVKSLNKEEVTGKIEFDNVIFTYDGNDEPTIKNFSLKVNPGQKIAIVGPTGAGKTTLVNLLMKFYDIDSGYIKINDIKTSELTRENVHNLFTMVLQDTWLFEGTIKENIIYNRDNITLEQIENVCREIGLDYYIKTMPNGYDSTLSESDTLSAGQKQLLTIARAMLDNSPFLILDEATSNVDTRTEELVQSAMDKLTIGRTSFIIAHRLSTIKNADLILVMKDGNIIETGNHDELIKQNGFYAELYNSQFQN